MNKSRLFVGLLLVAFLEMFAPASHAQTATNCQSTTAINCQVIGVGSSGIFSSAALAAVTGDPGRNTGPICNAPGATTATRFWTGSASGRDPRHTLTNPNIPDEGGTVWIAWDNDTAPTIICAYLSVDSIVGQRLFYSQGSGPSGPTNNGTLLLKDNTSSTPACTTAGANKVAFIYDTATTGVPSAVYNALEGTTGTTCPPAVLPVNFTTASTDVRPEDALFVGNNRVLAQDNNPSAAYAPDDKSALGYGSYNSDGSVNCHVPGIAIKSAWSNTSAQSICYDFITGDNDPISGTLIPPSQIVSEGALALIPIINVTNNASGSGGLGDLFANKGFNDVLSHDVAAGYAFTGAGTATLTRDLYLGNRGGIPVTVVHYLAREPQSGTYTTWEWQVIRDKDGYLGGSTLSQETNICGPSQALINLNSCGYFDTTNAANCPALNIIAGQTMSFSFPATQTCSNYASWGKNGFNALKSRVIGNGEMVGVSNVNCATAPAGSGCNIQDTFGYGFWSLGTYGGKNANIRYLQLDSNDALYAGWSSVDGGNNGVFPATDPNQNKAGHGILPAPPANGCDGYFNGDGGTTITNFSCSATNPWPYPTFANIQSGNYRAWSVNRVMWFVSAAGGTLNPNWTVLNPPAFWLSAADQTAVYPPATKPVLPDFFPFAYCANLAACPNAAAPTLTYPMNTFRSHYTAGSWPAAVKPANNGITAAGFGGAEKGGDVAGSAFTVQAEIDSVNFFGGSSFLSWIQ
jgi:hypothetical protein